MLRTKASVREKTRRRITIMLNLQLRALHLPGIKRYHAKRKQCAKSYDAGSARFERLKKELELPVYLLDISLGPADRVMNTRKNGYIQFLNWNSTLPVVAEVLGDRSPVSVSTGTGASQQCGIVRKVLSTRREWRDLAVLSMGPLHFRALTYVRRGDLAQMVVPLRSPMTPFQLGKAYRAEFVLTRLKAALAHRLAASKKSRRTA